MMRKHILLLAVISILGSAVGSGSPRVVRAAEDPALGERIYRENCAACHGEKGDGKGPEAQRLKTKPRDFTTGIYKFRSTPSGSLPLDQDIFRTISRGVRGTSMLAQLQLSEQERWAVVNYLKTFSKRFKEEKSRQAIAVPPAPLANSKLVALGKSKYEEAGCAQCHGAEGKGDAPSAEDLYHTLSTGLSGTPMHSYADAFSPKDRWALVSYILSIATHERARGMMGFVGEETQAMMIDMRAAMAGMMGGRRMMRGGGGMMNRDMNEMMKDMMGR